MFQIYFPLLLFFCLCLFFSILIFCLSYFLIKTELYSEKISSYECGFEPFNDARKKIDIRFYLVAILFIIFDLEIAYFFPWALDSYNLSFDGLFSMLFFFFLLTLGFAFEWKQGALEWE